MSKLSLHDAIRHLEITAHMDRKANPDAAMGGIIFTHQSIDVVLADLLARAQREAKLLGSLEKISDIAARATVKNVTLTIEAIDLNADLTARLATAETERDSLVTKIANHLALFWTLVNDCPPTNPPARYADDPKVREEWVRRVMGWDETPKSYRDCTCVGSCRGAAGLAPGWVCALVGPPDSPSKAPENARDIRDAAIALADHLGDPSEFVVISDDGLITVYCAHRDTMGRVPTVFRGWTVKAKYDGPFGVCSGETKATETPNA